jgi:hypothetical protein
MKPEWILFSPETGTDDPIYIERSAGEQFAGPCPAVLFMDGDDQFQAAIKAHREARAARAVAPCCWWASANRRGRDYMPVAHADESRPVVARMRSCGFSRRLCGPNWGADMRSRPRTWGLRGIRWAHCSRCTRFSAHAFFHAPPRPCTVDLVGGTQHSPRSRKTVVNPTVVAGATLPQRGRRRLLFDDR